VYWFKTIPGVHELPTNNSFGNSVASAAARCLNVMFLHLWEVHFWPVRWIFNGDLTRINMNTAQAIQVFSCLQPQTQTSNFLQHYGQRLKNDRKHNDTHVQTTLFLIGGLCVQSIPGTVSSGVDGTNSSESGVLGSAPPSNGDRYVIVNCSMNEVPYFLKYHHSNICSTINNAI